MKLKSFASVPFQDGNKTPQKECTEGFQRATADFVCFISPLVATQSESSCWQASLSHGTNKFHSVFQRALRLRVEDSAPWTLRRLSPMKLTSIEIWKFRKSVLPFEKRSPASWKEAVRIHVRIDNCIIIPFIPFGNTNKNIYFCCFVTN